MITDKEMIDYFLSNQEKFDSLKSYILKDTNFRYFPFVGNGHDIEYEAKISNQSKDYYTKTLDILKISDIGKRPDSSIFFYYYTQGDATWGVEKGYFYTAKEINSTNESIKVTNKDLNTEYLEVDKNCELYKRIKGDWYIFLRYDK